MNAAAAATASIAANQPTLIICSSCKDAFNSDEQIVNAKGEAFHTYCFV